jgi:hypothetical protein
MSRKSRLADDAFGPSIEGPADEIVSDAWDAKTPAARVKLARKALSIDLDAIDAYNILGLHAETLAEKIALFREGVTVGARLFAPIVGDEEMAWWASSAHVPGCAPSTISVLRSSTLTRSTRPRRSSKTCWRSIPATIRASVIFC